MKNFFRYFLTCLVVVLMTSCYTTKKVSMISECEHAYVGLPQTELVAKLGEPARSYTKDDFTVLVFEKFNGDSTLENRIYIDCYVDAQGVCRDIKTNYYRTERELDTKLTHLVIWPTVAGVVVLTGITVLTMHLTKK